MNEEIRKLLLVKLELFKLRRRTLLAAIQLQNRRAYQRGIYGERFFRGEFSRLVTVLKNSDPQLFFSYFRMDRDSFDEILEFVLPEITHKTNHRNPISSEQRLAITLR